MAESIHHFPIFETDIDGKDKRMTMSVALDKQRNNLVFSIRHLVGQYKQQQAIYFDHQTAYELLQRIPEALKMYNVYKRLPHKLINPSSPTFGIRKFCLPQTQMSHWKVCNLDLTDHSLPPYSYSPILQRQQSQAGDLIKSSGPITDPTEMEIDDQKSLEFIIENIENMSLKSDV